MLRRVQRFLDDFAAQLGAVNATTIRKELDQLVQDMGSNEAAQATSTLNAKAETATQQALRHDLVRHYMRPVARIAAAHLREAPGFEALKMPRKGIKVALLIAHAIAMAEAARAHEQLFAENGRPDLPDSLVAAAKAVRASIDARAQDRTTRMGAGQGLKATASRAHVVLRLLDTLVENALVDDPKALAEWRSAKRIGKGKKHVQGGDPSSSALAEDKA